MSWVRWCVLCLIVCVGCAPKKFYAPTPDYQAPTADYQAVPSFMNLPIVVPMEVLNTDMNTRFKGIIYNDDDFYNNNADNFKVKISRVKKLIKVDGYKEKIRIIMPLEVFAAYRWEACDACPVIEKSTEFEMDLTLVTVARVDKDWNLMTATSATDMVFHKKPVLEFGPISIQITPLVRLALNAYMPEITKGIDQEVAAAVPLRQHMLSAWDLLQDPIQVDSAYKAWLQLKPTQIMMVPIACDAKKLVLQAGMEAFIHTHLGDKPKGGKKSNLGAPVIREKLGSKFQLEMPVTIDYATATHLARQQLKDSTFTVSKKKKITINDVEIFGKGPEVFIRTDLSGSFKGVIYFKGKPTLDTVTNTLYLADFDFDIKTKNAIYELASWMAHGKLKSLFYNAFRYDLTADMEAARTTLNTYLKGYNYDDLFTVKGKVGKLHLKKVWSNEQFMQCVFFANGNASLTFSSFELNNSDTK